ncbi:MAG: DUF2147 domain-containing protein [Sphingomonas ursincola]|jgi:uncharacterized protein (DUF2147 family)|uniref:DUF2147 domain-containing protein n=3 Tax=Sphingomonadaceae TaxID=41297 RepID=A0A7V8RFZ8_9SPHN|nr:DUF2147 domain-containing protein [Sphingomonas ursincola]MBA4779376.1 DUF2147 domain-containing protein [Blastomonas sp.]MBY0621309.1 DUF2147 domain-containing protein [Sphingomonas ursincola]
MENNMRWSAIAAILGTSLSLMAVPAQASESIQGQWYTKGKRAVVTIAPCGQNMCGRLTRFIEQPKNGVSTDVNNPDPALRKRKLVGLPILSGFVPDGKKWRGKIYDPESGKTYRSIVTAGKNGTLSVEGCIAMFCQAQTWTAAK